MALKTKWETHAWQAHGALRVSANGHFLEHQDGQGFFWLGDTAWQLAKLKPEDIQRYLENRCDKGFNVIQFNATNFGSPNFRGELPFVGEGPPWSAVTLNAPYWQHIDLIVAQIKAYGLYAAVFAWWGPNADDPQEKSRQFFTQPDTHNYEYGKALGFRYRHEPHIIWVASGEYQYPYFFPPVPEQHLSRLRQVVEGIQATDEGKHLFTIHALSRYSSSAEFHHEVWLSFHMLQTHVWHDLIDGMVSADWVMTPAKPTLNGEGWYEAEEELFERKERMMRLPPALPNQPRFDTNWIQRYQAYWSVFFGGIGYTYGHMNLWTMSDLYQLYTLTTIPEAGVLLQSALDAPGSSALQYLRSLIESKPIQQRIPDQQLIAPNTIGGDGTLSPTLRCATRDHAGQWAFIYSTQGQVIQVVMHRLANGEVDAFWYNPRNGAWHIEGVDSATKVPFARKLRSGAGAPDYHFYPPGTSFGVGPVAGVSREGNDWVLVLEVQPS